MNVMAEALSKANIKVTDFEDRVVDQKAIEIDMQIEFMEKWLKLLERNAPEKEKHNFITKHGFVSVKQFSLYLACMDDVHELQYKLEDNRYYMTDKEIAKLEKNIAEKETMAENIKSVPYYRNILRVLGERDITPYGEDILKKRLY